MATLNQKRLGHGSQSFEIVGGKELCLATRTLGGANNQTFNLFDLDDKTEEHLHRPLKWIIIGSLILILALPLAINAISTSNGAYLVVSCIPLLAGLICIYQFFARVQHLVVFRYRNSGQVAFVLWKNNPSAEEEGNFVATLVEAISSAIINPRADNTQKLEIYRQYLGSFLADELITDEEAEVIFDRARNKLTPESSATVLKLAE